jgi:ankyrin repeat protein
MNTISQQMQAVSINTQLNIPILLQQLQTGDVADIYGEDESGRTLLMNACCVRNPDTPRVVKYLLSRHSLIDYQDNEGKTAIHYAAEMNSPELLNLLLTVQADCTNREGERILEDNYGRTPVFYASAENIPLLLDDWRIDNYGMTPLLYKIKCDAADCIGVIINEKPEEIVKVAPCGFNALHAAVAMKNYNLLSALVYAVPASDVKVKNRNGMSAIDMAISSQDQEAVRILWESWAFGESDIDKWIGIAASCGQESWREILTGLKHGRRFSRAHYV